MSKVLLAQEENPNLVMMLEARTFTGSSSMKLITSDESGKVYGDIFLNKNQLKSLISSLSKIYQEIDSPTAEAKPGELWFLKVKDFDGEDYWQRAILSTDRKWYPTEPLHNRCVGNILWDNVTQTHERILNGDKL